MRLLVDTDAFCKLAASDLLSDAAALFGAEPGDCGRLPALPHMLRRGSLVRRYGGSVCAPLIRIADQMRAVDTKTGPWLERLTPIQAVDPGEALLFAAAAEMALPVVTGDIRALQALRTVDGFPDALSGRIVVIEAVMLALFRRLGQEQVRRQVASNRAMDRALELCFSSSAEHAEDGLRSYYRSRERDLAPLVLWSPGEAENV